MAVRTKMTSAWLIVHTRSHRLILPAASASRQPPLAHGLSSRTRPPPRPLGPSCGLLLCPSSLSLVCVRKHRPGPRALLAAGLSRASRRTRVQGREEVGLSKMRGMSSVTPDHQVACHSPKDVALAAGGLCGCPRLRPVQLDPVVPRPHALHQRVCRATRGLRGHLPGNGPWVPGPCRPTFLGPSAPHTPGPPSGDPFPGPMSTVTMNMEVTPSSCPYHGLVTMGSLSLTLTHRPHHPSTTPSLQLHVHTHARVGL